MNGPVIHWFRQDLRLHDNPALHAAAQAGEVLAVYILDDDNAGRWAMGGASRWWLHYSLHKLNESLGGNLAIFKGDATQILPELANSIEACAVYWNRCYEPWRQERDARIKQTLENAGHTPHSYNGSLLWEPWLPLKDDGTPYKVFTPFYRKSCLACDAPRYPLSKPDALRLRPLPEGALNLDQLALLPRIRWDRKLEPHWIIGEDGAHERLETFLHEGLAGYKKQRDFPALPNVSRLSPRLHFGELSPNQVWYAAKAEGERQGGRIDKDVDHFCSELGWREFSYSQLYHFPSLPEDNLQSKFDDFPWREDDAALKRWQAGQTGYPLIDAAMRQLWQTGYMHNRLRMAVGSFLVKNLMLHWHEGERWFWDCLVDADMASNSASWQWIAGCGADAAPYFRVFNPILQGRKFDGDGAFTRQFVPELANLDDKYLHAPWEAPKEVLKQAGIRLGEHYPEPLVDVKASRERALAAFQSLKQDDNA